MTFKEWLESLSSRKAQTTGEDVADSIVFFLIMALLLVAAFK